MYAEKPQVKLAELELKKFDGEAVAGLTLTASNYDGAVEILKAWFGNKTADNKYIATWKYSGDLTV